MLSLTTATWELYCTVLYCTALYFTALYCTVLFCTAGGQLHPRQHADLLHGGFRPRRRAPARPAVRPHRHGARPQRHLHHPRKQVLQPLAQEDYDGRGQRSCKCNYVDFIKEARAYLRAYLKT